MNDLGHSRLLEQLLSGGAMRLGTLHVRFDAGYLGFQRLDTSVKLLDGHGIEILFCKLGKRVARLARKEVVEVHG